jgi:glycosyltransferase involved in cell wall biosynthesis
MVNRNIEIGNSQKIKVLYLKASNGIFGAERVMLSLFNNINRDQFEVLIGCISNRAGQKIDLLDEAQNYVKKAFKLYFGNRFSIKGILRLRRILKENSIQIINSHDYKTDIYAFISSIFLPIKLVSTQHGSIKNSGLIKFYLWIDEFLVSWFFDHIIAVADHIYQEFVGRGVKKEKITFVENRLDYKLITKEEIGKDNIKIKKGANTIGVVGRLFPDKGHEYLLKALPIILKEFPNTIVLIVGDGDKGYEVKLKNMSRKLGIHQHVQFCGYIKNIKKIYNIIDVFVMPSLMEGIPNVILEAMAFGKPIVATDVGGIPALIKDGETGILVKPKTIKELANGIIQVLKFRDYAKKMGEKAKEYVSGSTSIIMVRQNETVLKDLTLRY